MEFFDINNILVVIPYWKEGSYALSWIEAVGATAGLLCIWLASLEKTINYLFGLINVTLFAVIFFQIQLTPICCCRFSFSPPIFTAGMPGAGKMRKQKRS